MTNRKKLFILLSVLFGVAVLAMIIYSLIPRASILFSVAPEEVVVIINGDRHDIKSGGRVTVSPGEISIEIQRDEFDTYSESFTVENGAEHEVLVALNPQTGAARAMLGTDVSQEVIQRITGRDLKQGVEELQTTYPILRDLPIVDRFYKIIICESKSPVEGESKLAVCIQLFEKAARQSALDEIERRGYKLGDYEIIIQDLSYKTLREEAGE